MFATIVVGTDGSADARRAIRTAAELTAANPDSELHIVTAFHPLSLAELRRLSADVPDEYRPLLHSHVEVDSTRDEAARIVAEVGVNASFHQIDGEPVDVILDVAEHENADLIVVGSRGEGMAKRLWHGSVSTSVFHHSPCAVLIVKGDD